MKALIDADLLVYRIGHGAGDDPDTARVLRTVESTVLDIVMESDCEDYELFLTEGKGNFRNSIAVTAPYKGNRDSGNKPVHYDLIRDFMVDKLDAHMATTMEADDMLAIRSNEEGIDNTLIVSLDKDLDQVPGHHYNFVKQHKYTITQEQGNLLLAKQFLTGDVADNIKGVKGIGPVKAAKAFEDCSGWTEYWDVIVDKLGLERAMENGHLLYMLRTLDDKFAPDNPFLLEGGYDATKETFD